jgi:hypothetical protein
MTTVVILLLFLLSFLIGFAVGRRIGYVRGLQGGRAFTRIELREQSLRDGKCAICDKTR